MNDRQRRFAEHYASNPNATEAAKAAGYSEKTAYSIGQRLLKNVEVKHRIEELQAELAAARIADAREIKERMTAILRNDTERTTDRLKAADALLKSGGAYLPAAPPATDGKENDPFQDDEAEYEIVLPWNGTQEINAIMNSNGEFVRLLPSSGVTVYLTREQADVIINLFSPNGTIQAKKND